MKILYKQPQTGSLLAKLGVKNLYLKQMKEADSRNISLKPHHHNGFEIHIMDHGHQEYDVNGNKYQLDDRQILMIPPLAKHHVSGERYFQSKFAITFGVEEESPFTAIKDPLSCVVGEGVGSIWRLIFLIWEDIDRKTIYSTQITENRIFEILVMLLRNRGMEKSLACVNDSSEDERVAIAEQYIKDSIESNISVAEVASYCYLGTKQLTRLFKQNKGVTPFDYIQKQRGQHIEQLIYSGMSLKNISKVMNFSSEYHFNAFFKRYAGMPPGEFKKMNNLKNTNENI